MTISIYKSLIGKEDVKWWDGSADTTFTRETSSGGSATITKVGSGTYKFDDMTISTLRTNGTIVFPGQAQGNVLYFNGTIWAPLAPGTAGQVLTTGGAAANPSWTTIPATTSIRDRVRNLVIKNNATHADHQIDIDADEIMLQTATGASYRAESVNLTADITASGGTNDGLDTGVEAATTWYYIWVISNGTTEHGMLSTSATSPTMPNGYTYMALVGAVYNGAADLITIYQKDNRVSGPQLAAISNGGPATYTEIDLAAIVPATAKAAKGIYASLGAGGAIYIAPAGSGTTGYGEWAATASGATLSAGFLVDIYTPQKLYYYVVTANANIFITGWEY